MNAPTTCFAPSTSVTLRSNFATSAVIEHGKCTLSAPTSPSSPIITPRANLGALPPPGIPSGQDPLDSAPLRSFVPRPIETYDKRSFTDPIPQSWDGEITTIGVNDIEQTTEEEKEIARQIPVDASATSAFLEYSDMVREERKKELEVQAARNAMEVEGRATCGDGEGREYISNFDYLYLDGVKCVEYWGAPNGPVPRLFG